MTEELPVDVRSHPHWRILFRPSEFDQAKLSLTECVNVVEKAQVRLRGWPFPPLSRRQEQRAYGSTWFAAWSKFGGFGGHLEYWRLYQSTQFVYLGAVREKMESEWDAKIRANLDAHILDPPSDPEGLPGFLSLTNLVYSMTEYVEFASRLCEAEVYSGRLELRISLLQAKGYALTADPEWAPLSLYRVGTETLERVTEVDTAQLIANSRTISMETTLWFLERFGWINPPVSALRDIQDRFLARRS